MKIALIILALGLIGCAYTSEGETCRYSAQPKA